MFGRPFTHHGAIDEDADSHREPKVRAEVDTVHRQSRSTSGGHPFWGFGSARAASLADSEPGTVAVWIFSEYLEVESRV